MFHSDHWNLVRKKQPTKCMRLLTCFLLKVSQRRCMTFLLVVVLQFPKVPKDQRHSELKLFQSMCKTLCAIKINLHKNRMLSVFLQTYQLLWCVQ